MKYVRDVVVNNVKYRLTRLAEISNQSKWDYVQLKFNKAAKENEDKYPNIHIQLDETGQYLELVGVEIIGRNDPTKE